MAAKQQNHKARKKKQHFWLQTTTAGVVDQLSPQARLPGPDCRVEATACCGAAASGGELSWCCPWRIFFSSLKLNRTYLLERMTGGYRSVLPQTWAVSGPPVSCTDACGYYRRGQAVTQPLARPAGWGTASSYSFTECSHLLVYCSAGFPA